MKKKLLSLLMALCLVVTLLPVNALAADASADAETDLVEGSAGKEITTKVGSADNEGNPKDNNTRATVGSGIGFDNKGKITSGTLEQVSTTQLADGKVTVPQEDGTLKVEEMTTTNAPVVVSAGTTTTAYTTLAVAIEAANNVSDEGLVTVTIQQSGTYAPFTITRANVTVQAAEEVLQTLK